MKEIAPSKIELKVKYQTQNPVGFETNLSIYKNTFTISLLI